MREAGRAAILVWFCAGCQAASAPEELEARASAIEGGAGACSPETLFTSVGNPLSCCEDGNKQYLTLDGTRLAHRLVGT